MADYYDIVTADSTNYSADETQWPSADGGLLTNLVTIVEPVGRVITADSTLVSADNVDITADGGPLLGAGDVLDAEVEAAELPIGGAGPWFEPRRAVVGYGFGVLPRLWGEAHGTVGHAGDAVGTLSLSGAGFGEVDNDDLELLLILALAA